jgi:hypothetical protein
MERNFLITDIEVNGFEHTRECMRGAEFIATGHPTANQWLFRVESS